VGVDAGGEEEDLGDQCLVAGLFPVSLEAML